MEEKKPRIKILVACHKADPNIRQDDIYMPIQVGKALHPELDLGFQCDNTGDNISEKNASYCELTALYWAWKNLKDVDYIGLCHYRRYFDFGKSGMVNMYMYRDIDSLIGNDQYRYLLKILKKKDFILPKHTTLPIPLFSQYSYSHNSEDLRELNRVIDEIYPDYSESFRYIIFNNNCFFQYNMFITSWREFDCLCQWLFGVLSSLEDRLHIEHYNSVQSRIYGYLSERLINVYAHKNNLRIKEIPVAFIGDTKVFGSLRTKCAKIKNNILFRLSK